VPGYRNFTVLVLVIGVRFRKHPVERIISYVEISTYIHVPCNYSQNYLLIRTTLTPSQKNCNNTFSFSRVQIFAVAAYMDKPKKN